MTEYRTVVGLEVHIQMNTKTKAFCKDALSFGADPNTHVGVVSLSHPGTLPVANKEHVKKAVSLGLALGCKINSVNTFDRKHYYYADLPKAYQITQDRLPVCVGGSVDIETSKGKKTIRIHHIHMEEDAGKTIHDKNDNYSLVDLNRAGTPLLELVSEPDLNSGEEVLAFIAELQKLVRYLDVSDGDMEKGSMRCDVNVSVNPIGASELGERCEVKNVNSKKFAKAAVEHETKRQIALLEDGQTFNKQTLHFDPVTGHTSPMRDKEDADDYRYFPDPDLPPVVISIEEIEAIIDNQPALPWEVKNRMVSEFGLSEYDSKLLSETRAIGDYFISLTKMVDAPKILANLIINKLLPSLGQKNIEQFEVPKEQIIQFATLIKDNKVGKSTANQQLWPALLDNPMADVEILADKLGIIQKSDNNFISTIIAEVISENPGQVAEYKNGKKKLFGFIVGQAMKKSKGAAPPDVIKKALIEALK